MAADLSWGGPVRNDPGRAFNTRCLGVPMRVQVLSDIHLDHQPTGREAARRMLDPTAHVIALAGDIGESDGVRGYLEWICSLVPDSKVVAVLGNHDYFGSVPSELEAALDSWNAPSNLHLLRNGAVDVPDPDHPGSTVRFAGGTLWFPYSAAAVPLERMMADFRYIKGFHTWVYAEHIRSLGFLAEEATKADVFITHHLPNTRCVDAVYKKSPLNAFFVSGASDELEELPRYWIFGHTHAANDFVERGCRFLCNPHGYPCSYEGVRKGYIQPKTIEIKPRGKL